MSDVSTGDAEGGDGVEPRPGEDAPEAAPAASGVEDHDTGAAPSAGAPGVRRFGPLHLAAALGVGLLLGVGLGWAIGQNQGDTSTEAVEVTGRSDVASTTPAPTVTEPPPSTTVPTTTTTAPVSAIGTEFQSGDIFLTVTGVTASPTLERNDNGDIIQQPAASGGHFVTVSTTGRNESSEALDLTCSYYIGTHLIDSEGREYEPVEDLYQIPGNPECNAQLNPGFGFTMNWPYMVPTDAEIVALRFQDVVAIDSTEPEVDIPIEVG